MSRQGGSRRIPEGSGEEDWHIRAEYFHFSSLFGMRSITLTQTIETIWQFETQRQLSVSTLFLPAETRRQANRMATENSAEGSLWKVYRLFIPRSPEEESVDPANHCK